MLTIIPPNLATLLEIGPQIEPALQQLLAPILPTFVPRSAESLPDERIDITFSQGKWSGRWLPDGAGDLQHSTWDCTITLSVFTVRKKVNDDGSIRETDLQPIVRQKIRTALLGIVGSATFLPWHAIAQLNESAATESVDTGEDSDVSALKWDALITIRSDAMAAVNVPA